MAGLAGAVGASFASELPAAPAALLQAAFAASGDPRAIGLFLFLRFFCPYLSHPDRWQRAGPAARARCTAFARRLGQLASLQDELRGSLLEPLLFALATPAEFYGPLLARPIAPRTVPLPRPAMQALRLFMRSRLAELRDQAAEEDDPAGLWNLLALSGSGGHLKRSASWCL